MIEKITVVIGLASSIISLAASIIAYKANRK